MIVPALATDLAAGQTSRLRVGGFVSHALSNSPTRAEVLAALRPLRFQGIAYARPVEWDAKGDNKGAVIFVNVVDGERFREVAEITPDEIPR